MPDIDDVVRRHQIRETLRAKLEGDLERRIDRYLEVNHQNIVANHHFAVASTECLELYRDGYFLSTVMVSQSVVEGIFRYVLDSNRESSDGRERPELADFLVTQGIVSDSCAEAFIRVWKSFRNDIHHMNPKVAEIPFPQLAKRNIDDLAIIEREIFAYTAVDGKFFPVQPKYWSLNPDGAVPVFFAVRIMRAAYPSVRTEFIELPQAHRLALGMPLPQV
jgi:hypothetical protein